MSNNYIQIERELKSIVVMLNSNFNIEKKASLLVETAAIVNALVKRYPDSFADWFEQNYDQEEIAFVVEGGYPSIEQYSTASSLYSYYKEEIWELVQEGGYPLGEIIDQAGQMCEVELRMVNEAISAQAHKVLNINDE